MNLLSFVLILLYFTLCSCKNESNPSIIVIGAGASGIAVSARLFKHGFSDIKILEAENRIGGRINSVKFGDAFVDLGAEWCHGVGEDIIVYLITKKYNILKEVVWNTSNLYYSGGELDMEVHDDITRAVGEMFTTEDSYNSSYRNLSVKDHFLKNYAPILEKYKNDPKKSQQAKEGIFCAETSMERYESSFDWGDISFFSNYVEPSELKNLHWDGLGYHTILKILMETYPDPKKGMGLEDKIILSKEVKTIHWNNDNKKAKVECTDGSNFEADHVIFTPSIGVLKNHHETLFNPKLDADKVEAIKKIGFGAVVKIVLHFENPWWNSEDTGLFFMWSDEDNKKLLAEFPDAPKKDDKSWLSYFQFLMPAENNPKVLICWISGPTVPDIETMKKEEITKGIMFAIRKMFGHKYNITDPDSMIHSKWWNNPHFHGSWSYETVEGNSDSTKDYHAILARPLKKDGKVVVTFAGEATHSTKFSTVHGAIESGLRETDRIMRLYDKQIIH